MSVNEYIFITPFGAEPIVRGDEPAGGPAIIQEAPSPGHKELFGDLARDPGPPINSSVRGCRSTPTISFRDLAGLVTVRAARFPD